MRQWVRNYQVAISNPGMAAKDLAIELGSPALSIKLEESRTQCQLSIQSAIPIENLERDSSQGELQRYIYRENLADASSM